jgi:hypothetical protein
LIPTLNSTPAALPAEAAARQVTAASKKPG